MKKIIAGAVLLSVSTCLVVAGQVVSKQSARVLVLGFQSRQLNDVQDRLLREAVLYRLHRGGHAIVPVMEIEALFQGDAKRRIRSLSRADVRSLCDELNAGTAATGSLAPESGRQDDPEIRAGKTYICLLTVYRKSDDRFSEVRLAVAGRESLFDFINDVAGRIVEEIGRK